VKSPGKENQYSIVKEQGRAGGGSSLISKNFGQIMVKWFLSLSKLL